MRVADIDRAGLVEAIPADRHHGRVHAIGKRDRVPFETGFTHIDTGAACRRFDADCATCRFNICWRAMEEGNGAAGVATGSDLAAILIEDPHAEIGSAAWLQKDQLIAPDPGATVGERAGDAAIDVRQVLCASIKHDKVIAQSMHFGEIDAHRAAHLCIWRRSVQYMRQTARVPPSRPG